MARTVCVLYFLANVTDFILAQCSVSNRYKYTKSKMISLVLAAFLPYILAQDIPCGTPTVAPIEKKIVGGQEARPGSWPWMTLFVNDYGYIMGSGSILNNRVIMTSAQLFEGYGYNLYTLDVDYWRVYAGQHDITVTDPHEAYYSIKRVFIHPDYNYTTLENDIALVVTSTRIVYNNHTRPVCLPDGSVVPTTGQTCYLAGWGSTEQTSSDEVLNQVDMPILNDSVCLAHWHDYLSDTELCAGYENGGKDFCWDDIGSPLVCKGENGVWYAQGIAVGGGNCTIADEPGVFEDVSRYTEWVQDTMNTAGYPYQYS